MRRAPGFASPGGVGSLPPEKKRPRPLEPRPIGRKRLKSGVTGELPMTQRGIWRVAYARRKEKMVAQRPQFVRRKLSPDFNNFG